MASGNTGTLYSAYMPRQFRTIRAAFYWNLTNINADAGTATLNYRLYMQSNDAQLTEYKMYGTGDRNYLKINGNDVYRINDVGNASYSNPHKMYVNYTLDDKYTPRWVDWGYTFQGWIVKWGELASGSTTIYYDDNGNASFNVYGAFQCFNGAGMDDRVYINDTVYVNKIERNSNVALKKNGAWDSKGGNIWYKNGSWSKKNFYRKENGSWNKK